MNGLKGSIIIFSCNNRRSGQYRDHNTKLGAGVHKFNWVSAAKGLVTVDSRPLYRHQFSMLAKRIVQLATMTAKYK